MENINSKILAKFDDMRTLIAALIPILGELGESLKQTNAQPKMLASVVKTDRLAYVLRETVAEFRAFDIDGMEMEYIDGMDSISSEADLMDVLHSHGVISFLNEVANHISNMIITITGIPETYIETTRYDEIKAKINALGNIKQMVSFNFDFSPTEDDGHLCSACGVVMELMPESSQIVCPDCKNIEIFVGGNVRDEYERKTRITHEPLRHYKTWIRTIQALEETKISHVVDVLRVTLARDNVKINSNIRYHSVRKYLKEIKMTQYNRNIPKIMRELIGIAPPRLSSAEYDAATTYFINIISIYDEMHAGEADTNRLYYPYFIYKILEWMFRANPEKLKIIDYIHLQSTGTSNKHDAIFKQICSRGIGITYCKTSLKN
jgi:predicted RNA-binding Zn-ribbon protein involved in translation (DUF1610 family)